MGVSLVRKLFGGYRKYVDIPCEKLKICALLFKINKRIKAKINESTKTKSN